MGNDGGSIPMRCELVKEKKKEVRPDPHVIAQSKFQFCALTKLPLERHIVADHVGNLFLKEEICRALVSKSLPSSFSHIKSLKDLIDVTFTSNPDFVEAKEKTKLAGDGQNEIKAPFICPITNHPTNGKIPFVVVKSCGHVFSDKGIKELAQQKKTDEHFCFTCQKPFTKNDLIPLANDAETTKKMIDDLKSQKKINKRKKMDEQDEKVEKDDKNIKQPKLKKRKIDKDSKKSDLPSNINVKATLEKTTKEHEQKKKVSEAYKSIFTPATSNKGVYVTGIYNNRF